MGMVAERLPIPADRGGPIDRIGDDPLDLGQMERRVRLVPRTEVEDTAASAVVAAAAAENLTAAEPADQDQGIGLGHVEELAVHLLVLDDDGFAQVARDGMARIDDPEALRLRSEARRV